MNTDMISKRVDYRMRQMEKECKAREKTLKNRKPANVVAAEDALRAIQEMDAWEGQTREQNLSGKSGPPIGTLSGEALQIIQERLDERAPWIERLRKIEIHVKVCKDIADETKEAIRRGDQYVNYSHITLKAGGPSIKDNEALLVAKGDGDGDVETRVNLRVLRVPKCGKCDACTVMDSKKLCEKRLEEQKKPAAAETKKIRAALKRKAEAEGRVFGVNNNNNSNGNGGVGGNDNNGEGGDNSKKRKLDGSFSHKSSDGDGGTNGDGNDASSSAAKQPPPQRKRPRITSQGNKRMAIPDEVFPEFCRHIGSHGTSNRTKMIHKFLDDYPDVSNRQVNIKFTEVTVKEPPKGLKLSIKKTGRAFHFYLRPRFYDKLPEEDRPEDWEMHMRKDQAAWQQEQAKIKADLDKTKPGVHPTKTGSVQKAKPLVRKDTSGDASTVASEGGGTGIIGWYREWRGDGR